MSYLLDTCILSKRRKNNSRKLREWLDQSPETDFFVSVVTIGEIQKGISKIRSEEVEKKTVFENWLWKDLIPCFEQRILVLDLQTCVIWGRLCGEAQRRGNPLPVVDLLIAASAIQHQLVLVTENTKDFLATGISLFNPCV